MSRIQDKARALIASKMKLDESEIVGLTPAKAMIDCAEYYLKAKDFDCKKQVMEYHLIDMNH